MQNRRLKITKMDFKQIFFIFSCVFDLTKVYSNKNFEVNNVTK